MADKKIIKAFAGLICDRYCKYPVICKSEEDLEVACSNCSIEILLEAACMREERRIPYKRICLHCEHFHQDYPDHDECSKHHREVFWDTTACNDFSLKCFGGPTFFTEPICCSEEHARSDKMLDELLSEHLGGDLR